MFAAEVLKKVTKRFSAVRYVTSGSHDGRRKIGWSTIVCRPPDLRKIDDTIAAAQVNFLRIAAAEHVSCRQV